MGSKNWCFTLNNYTEDDVSRLKNLVSTNSRISYIIFGKEVAETGTPHLQGFVSCKVKTRLINIKDILGSNPHLQPAKKVIASITYCKKEGDWVEFGSMSQKAGSRTDIDDFKESVKEGMLNFKDIREKHAEVYAKYPRFCIEYVKDNMPKVKIPDHPLRPWQQHLDNLLSEEPNRRTIIFVVDITGNSGKSWFADWYQSKSEDSCQVITPSNTRDMTFALNLQLRVLFMDAPRSKQHHFIQYDFLENLKNGRVFQEKYEAGMKFYEPMHIVVLMNEEPDMTKLSRDRYKIINIDSFPDQETQMT